MKIIGDHSSMIELRRKSSDSDLLMFDFSCAWCSGTVEIFSDKKNFEQLLYELKKVVGGKKTLSWLSEEGNLELKMKVLSTGSIEISVHCFTLENTKHSGKVEFDFVSNLGSLDCALLSSEPLTHTI